MPFLFRWIFFKYQNSWGYATFSCFYVYNIHHAFFSDKAWCLDHLHTLTSVKTEYWRCLLLFGCSARAMLKWNWLSFSYKTFYHYYKRSGVRERDFVISFSLASVLCCECFPFLSFLGFKSLVLHLTSREYLGVAIDKGRASREPTVWVTHMSKFLVVKAWTMLAVQHCEQFWFGRSSNTSLEWWWMVKSPTATTSR